MAKLKLYIIISLLVGVLLGSVTTYFLGRSSLLSVYEAKVACNFMVDQTKVLTNDLEQCLRSLQELESFQSLHKQEGLKFLLPPTATDQKK